MAARYGVFDVVDSASSHLLRILGRYGDDGSRDNSSASWAEFDLYDDVTALPCVLLGNGSCTNETSLDDGSTYPYAVWQVSLMSECQTATLRNIK